MGRIYAFYGGRHPFSNMYEYIYQYELHTVEKDWQAKKAAFFGDDETLEEIEASTDPKKAKKLGRTVVPFDAEEWDDVKEDFMRASLRDKWAKCPEFQELLLDVYAHYDYIAEASPRDTYWGTGYGKERTEAGECRGKNRLGELLMELAKEQITKL